MSALAGILGTYGKKISGSDFEASQITAALKKEGAVFYTGHSSANIKQLDPADSVVIYSLAVDNKNLELKEARRKKIPVFSYPEAVGCLTRDYFTVAVCGTHGKSTITAMLAKIFIENGFDPTVIVGTKLKELGDKNFRVGKSKLLILEACEYKRAFLNYSPKVIVLHTLDPDHFDYYRSFEDYLSAFEEFTCKLPGDGYFISNLDDEDIHDILQKLQKNKFPSYNTFTYSKIYSTADFYLDRDKILRHNITAGQLKLKIPGEHNRCNALAAFALSSVLGMSAKNILKSLNDYNGAFRRFEIKGKIGKTIIIDDYGHHPIEIQATLAAAREKFLKAKICVVYQPHQHSRTKSLFKQLGESFSLADTVIIPNIYKARDTKTDIASVSPQRLVAEIKKYNKHVMYGEGLPATAKLLQKTAKNYDVVIIMGAGDVWKIADGIKFS